MTLPALLLYLNSPSFLPLISNSTLTNVSSISPTQPHYTQLNRSIQNQISTVIMPPKAAADEQTVFLYHCVINASDSQVSLHGRNPQVSPLLVASR